jgi:hypothetical protein
MNARQLIPALLLLAAAGTSAQVHLDFGRLAAKAKQSVEVNLDPATLAIAGQFLSDKKPAEAQVKNLAAGLKGIYVRTFQFSRPGEVTASDLDWIRSQVLKTPGWTRIVNVQSKADQETSEIYLRTERGQPSGVFILAAEPKQLTVVHILGNIDLAKLSALRGHFGVPPAKK